MYLTNNKPMIPNNKLNLIQKNVFLNQIYFFLSYVD